MPDQRDRTVAFLRILVLHGDRTPAHRQNRASELSESHDPFNPIDASLSLGSPEDRFAYGQAFQKVLYSKEEIELKSIASSQLVPFYTSTKMHFDHGLHNPGRGPDAQECG
jgi:hypothetical protein